MTDETGVTTLDIAQQLLELAQTMIDLGATMDYYGGMGEMGIHGRELIGAGKVAASWSSAIQEGGNNAQSHPRADD